jgi:NADPH-dependent 2,4-dienoyl-CoA reductase/sulfur reductase-like enzyme
MNRRLFLAHSAAAATLLAVPSFSARAEKSLQIVVVGGGWGGLAAAAELARLLPTSKLTVIEPQPRFFSLPLSNKVLAGKLDLGQLYNDRGAAASRHGYVWRRERALTIDRQKRQVVTESARLDYDWLVVAPGISHNYSAWFGTDMERASVANDRFNPAFETAAQFIDLQRRIESFTGGDWLVTIPPMPRRCPPAVYERALAIAQRFKQRKLAARVIVVDSGPGIPIFRRMFADRFRQWVHFMPYVDIETINIELRRVISSAGEIAFDDALLMPPQQASRLISEIGLSTVDVQGNATGWAVTHERHLHAANDERVFVVGDSLGPVSPLFGHYPKTAQVALRLGQIAATQVVAMAAGKEPPDVLPDGICHVTTDFELPEAMSVESTHRRRGDGVIAQTLRQESNLNPRGEDEAWLQSLRSSLI